METYKKWEPLEGIEAELWVEALHDDYEGLRILLCGNESSSSVLRMTFSHYYVYRNAAKFPEAKKAVVQRSRSVLSGMFAEQLAPYLPNFPFSPTEAKFIGAPIDFLVFKGLDEQRIEFVEVKFGSARLNLE